jgi:hypothetical protein
VGLSSTEIAKAVSFVGFSFVVGMVMLSGGGVLIEPDDVARLLGLPAPSLRLIGALALALVAGYAVWTFVRRGRVRLGPWKVPTPSPAIVAAQLVVPALDRTLAGALTAAESDEEPPARKRRLPPWWMCDADRMSLAAVTQRRSDPCYLPAMTPIMPRPGAAALLCWMSAIGPTVAAAQIQIRVGDPTRATYSELHEALREGSKAADSVVAIQRIRSPALLWRTMTAAISGTGDWNSGLIALTRLAELRNRAYADSAARFERRLEQAEGPPFPQNPGLKADDVIPSLNAIILERRRAVRGDSAVLADILSRIPTRAYDHGDAWVLGRLRAGAADSVSARFLAAPDTEFKVRYLTLLSYFTDTTLVPLMKRVYAAPDSFGIPPRMGIRASDALLWIGTRGSLQALLDARDEARARGVYADPALARGGYDFLANDSSSVISRTGKWLDQWVRELK